MIATIRGQVTEKLPDSLIVELAGVGYELFVTVDDWGAARVGGDAKYYIYEQIREDIHNLYGFSSLDARLMFVQLLAVNGVGPKVALQILSSAGLTRLRQAIASGDPALLKGITGVGPKTAQRVLVELRGKISAEIPGLAPVTDSAYQALVSLGYTSAQATAAVVDLPSDVTDEAERIKLALRAPKK
jgi:Holliday junction DNA helicase RuvA